MDGWTLLVAVLALFVALWSAWSSHRAVQIGSKAATAADRSAIAAEDALGIAADMAESARKSAQSDSEIAEIENRRHRAEIERNLQFTLSNKIFDRNYLRENGLFNSITHRFYENALYLEVRNVGPNSFDGIYLKIVEADGQTIKDDEVDDDAIGFGRHSIRDETWIGGLAVSDTHVLALTKENAQYVAIDLEIRVRYAGKEATINRSLSWQSKFYQH
jgi:hypothetical protein